MYSDKRNILQLVALLKAHNVCHIVISPGARNWPITQSLASDSFFKCYSVVDERNAGFFALGVCLNNKYDTVALCCTSGSAFLNYGPAIAEASQQQVGFVVITADRPEQWVGQLENQSIQQMGLFSPYIKKSVNLPELRPDEDDWYCNRLINEALLEVNYGMPGPVHINVQIAEPLFEFTVEHLPEVRVINRLSKRDKHRIDLEIEYERYADMFGNYDKVMLLMGQGDYFTLDIWPYNLFEELCNSGCVVLGEYLATGISAPNIIRNFDTILYALPEEEWESYAPDLLITVKGHIVSKRLKRFLRLNKPKAHWHISTRGEIVDTYQCLTDVIEGHPTYVLPIFLNLNIAKSGGYQPYERNWRKLSAKVVPPKPGYSDLMAVGELMKALPEASRIHLGNSSSVRLALLFPISIHYPRVYANRGTSGIEGCLSTAAGYAASEEKDELIIDMNFVITGDLAFFHNMNAIWNYPVEQYGFRILLNNNGGGEIFHTLPGFENTEITKKYITAKHKTSAKDWATENGFLYFGVSNEDDLKKYMPAFADREVKSPILMEVFTDMFRNLYELETYYQSVHL
ncbi:2-succinyl-5-enolpyruvyl-6-hydroxy-3-cyclohexene-1-carboxylate synthase [Bacteroidia bacterium]|nr:2-succinyl-5-enolpyruvyl-6-hydroxy-3-cyclohexene-1-carboxylate synthase [Bacteroidia bacterium]